MNPTQAKSTAFGVVLSLSIPFVLARADMTPDSASAINNQVVSTGTTTQMLQHHRKHKPRPGSTNGPPGNSGVTNDTSGLPESPDSHGPGNAGIPNMGTGDHTPGTSGTSGD